MEVIRIVFENGKFDSLIFIALAKVLECSRDDSLSIVGCGNIIAALVQTILWVSCREIQAITTPFTFPQRRIVPKHVSVIILPANFIADYIHLACSGCCLKKSRAASGYWSWLF